MRRTGTPTLPGERRGRPRIVRESEPTTNPARRKPDALRKAILAALANGPLMKWQLRETLHEPELVIYKMLRILRKEGKLKVVGRCLDQRAWALRSYDGPAPTVRAGAHKPGPTPRAVPPKDSWWAKPWDSREGFSSAQQQRSHDAGWQGVDRHHGS